MQGCRRGRYPRISMSYPTVSVHVFGRQDKEGHTWGETLFEAKSSCNITRSEAVWSQPQMKLRQYNSNDNYKGAATCKANTRSCGRREQRMCPKCDALGGRWKWNWMAVVKSGVAVVRGRCSGTRRGLHDQRGDHCDIREGRGGGCCRGGGGGHRQLRLRPLCAHVEEAAELPGLRYCHWTLVGLEEGIRGWLVRLVRGLGFRGWG